MKNLIVLICSFFLISCSSNPKMIIETSLGDIECELFYDDAPISSANFIKYLDEQRFDSACFYRVVTMDNQPANNVKIEVVQGGLFKDEHPLMLQAIAHEDTQQTGILHMDGTISMARNLPGSASSEFFICIGRQPELDFGGKRNPDGQGFAAFGKVVKGMEVVKNIHRLANTNQLLDERVLIISMRRL